MRLNKLGRCPNWSASDSCLGSARRVLPALAALYFRASRELAAGSPSPSDLHELRLATKRLRYCLELFREAYGTDLEDRIRSLKSVQDCLGTISDCDTTEAMLHNEGLTEGGDARLLLDFLGQRKRTSTASFMDLWKSRFDGSGQEEDWVRYLRGGADQAAGSDSGR